MKSNAWKQSADGIVMFGIILKIWLSVQSSDLFYCTKTERTVRC